MWSANGSMKPTDYDCDFVNLEQVAWYRNAVLWAVENGITGGTSETSFFPNKACTGVNISMFLLWVLMN